MRRGDICLADLDTALGNEANKVRPVVIVSNDAANAYVSSHHQGTVAVVPVTSRTDSGMLIHTFLPAEIPGLDHDSVAQAEQVRTISVKRIKAVIGFVPSDIMLSIDDSLRVHLNL